MNSSYVNKPLGDFHLPSLPSIPSLSGDDKVSALASKVQRMAGKAKRLQTAANKAFEAADKASSGGAESKKKKAKSEKDDSRKTNWILLSSVVGFTALWLVGTNMTGKTNEKFKMNN
jgi:hypothetical protein